MAAEKSFWGLIVKPEKRYEQIVEESFHISKACLEPNSAGKGITSMSIEVESEEFLLCNLQAAKLSDNLDLNFVAGEKICFKTEGSGTIHLTGYLIPDDEDLDPYMMSDDDDDEEDFQVEIPALVNGQNKRKGGQELSLSPQKKSKDETPLDKAFAENKKKGLNLKAPQNDAEVKAAVKKAEEMRKKVALAAEQRKKKASQEDSDEQSDEDDDDEVEEEEDDDEEESDEEESDDDMEDDEETDEDDDEGEEEPTAAKAKGDSKTPEKKKEQQKSPSKGPKTPQANGAPTPDAKSGKKNKSNGQETPGKQQGKDEKSAAKGTPAKTGETPKKAQKTPRRTLKGGVIVEDVKEGSGPEAKRGKMVGMFYEGRLSTNNKKFDGKQSGEPFKFRLGNGEVIKGWDVGVEGMKVGGKRLLTIPPKMAYGDKPMDGIPANSTLKFEVECKFVN